MTENFDALKDRFSYHKPDEARAFKHQKIRAACFDLALLIDQFAPDSREKSLALTKLEEAAMWSNAAVARHPDPRVDG